MTHEIIGDVLKVVLGPALTWITGQVKKPSQKTIEEQVEKLVAKHLPATVPIEERDKTIGELTQIVVPTLEEVIRFNKTSAKVAETLSPGVKKSLGGKSVIKRSTSRQKAPQGTSIKKSSIPEATAKKATRKKTVPSTGFPRLRAKPNVEI